MVMSDLDHGRRGGPDHTGQRISRGRLGRNWPLDNGMELSHLGW